MKKKWLVATYKIREVARLEYNLQNQNFDYYLPKITINRINFNSKEVLLFPGYIFVNIGLENYSALQYTIGIKSIIKFGNNIAYLSNEDIETIKMAEQASKKEPIASKIQIGQDAIISKGSLKGNMVKICSLPSKKRVGVLLTFLGAKRRVIIPVKDLNF